jgi:DNA-binding NtrC family response regulator
LSGKEIQGLSPEVMSVLMAHDFPGNIRELENIIEYGTVVCKNGLYRHGTPSRPSQKSKEGRTLSASDEKRTSLKDVERGYFTKS